MNFLGDKITTATTIAETMSELASTELLEVQVWEGKQKLISNYKNSWVSKSNIVRKVNNFEEIYEKGAQVRILPKSHNTKIGNRFQKCEIKIMNSLQKLFFKKKRFTFQILKQFFLFPDDSQSSISTLSTYNPLIFKDEIIHTFIKKMETKIIENKIWGFLNLRMRPYLKAANKIERASNKIYKKVTFIHKKEGFESIKKISDDLISYISKGSHCFDINSNLSLQNEGMRCFVDEKKKFRGQLDSGIIKEIVPPVKNQNQNKIELRSTTRIYTLQEYEKKYGKSLDNKDQGLNFRVTKNQPSDQRFPNVSPVANKGTQTSRTQNKEYSPSQKGFNKYNIIHYYERPREGSNPLNMFQSIGPKALSSCSSCCAHYCYFCEYGNFCCPHYKATNNQVVSCCSRSHQMSPLKNKHQAFNETAFIEKHKSIRKISQVYSAKKYNPTSNELSQLESRIQYLNFLRKVVKQQQAEHATK